MDGGDFDVVSLVDRGKLARPEGIVYSTAPVTSLDSEGRTYVVKGPEQEVVVAETIAHLLAAELGIQTPDFALGRYEDDNRYWFASVMETNALRDAGILLTSKLDPATIVFLGELFAFDAWIANVDRNLGNILVRFGHGKLDPVAIDFEKAQTLRGPNPLVQTGMIENKKLRPTGDLGKVVSPPIQADGFVRRLDALSEDRIKKIFEKVESVIGVWPWAASSITALVRRKARIQRTLAEIWQ